MGKRSEGDCLRELQGYFDQKEKIGGDDASLWKHASDMCSAFLCDMKHEHTGAVESAFTRIIGELVVEKASFDKKLSDLQRAVRQSNSDEHAALSAVDRLRGELKSAKESLQVSCDATSRLERKLAEFGRAARLTDGELEALSDVNRDRRLINPGSRVAQLANFAGRVRSVLEPYIIDAMPAETPAVTDAPHLPISDSPGQRLRAVEQDMKFLWPVVEAMSSGCSEMNLDRVSALARIAVSTREQARKERAG